MGILRCGNEPKLILHRGPVIQIGVSHPVAPTQMEEGAEIKGEHCSALIDTGARSSMISPNLAKKLDLPVHSFYNLLIRI